MRRFATLVIVIGMIAGAVHAASDDVPSVFPKIVKAIGPEHPEGNEFMRVNHMNLLVDDRNKTVRLGDRSVKYSLKECVACHAVMGPDAQPIPVNAENQFCAACHAYAAVKMDCFQCHKTTPDKDTAALLLKRYPENADLKALVAYLDGVKE